MDDCLETTILQYNYNTKNWALGIESKQKTLVKNDTSSEDFLDDIEEQTTQSDSEIERFFSDTRKDLFSVRKLPEH